METLLLKNWLIFSRTEIKIKFIIRIFFFQVVGSEHNTLIFDIKNPRSNKSKAIKSSNKDSDTSSIITQHNTVMFMCIAGAEEQRGTFQSHINKIFRWVCDFYVTNGKIALACANKNKLIELISANKSSEFVWLWFNLLLQFFRFNLFHSIDMSLANCWQHSNYTRKSEWKFRRKNYSRLQGDC